MGQIMQRLLEGVQAELQAQERELCAHLNTLASWKVLPAKDSQQEDPAGSNDLAAGSSQETADGEAAGGAAAKQKRKRKPEAGGCHKVYGLVAHPVAPRLTVVFMPLLVKLSVITTSMSRHTREARHELKLMSHES